MSTESNLAESTSAPIGSPEQLIAAREKRGWSMSDVASKLGMMPRQIDAIENGRWEALPGHAFVRGAIRAYGNALQADVGPLLATLGEKTHAPELRASASLDAPLPRRGALGFDNGGSGSRLTWIVLGVLGVVAIAMYFGRGADLSRVLDAPTSGRTIESVPVQPSGTTAVPQGARDSATSGSAPAQQGGASTASGATAGAAAGTTGTGAGTATGATAGTAAGMATGTASGAQAPAGTTEPGGARSPAASVGGADGRTPASAEAPRADSGSAAASGSAGQVPGADASSGSAAGTASTTGQAPVASANALVLRFERESWVEIRDASGRRLLYGTEPAQSMREVSGSKPYSVTIGNAPFVRLEHAGRTIDLGAVTRNGVARLTVD